MIEGMAELLGNIARLETKVSGSLEKAAEAAALIGERYTKEGAPVDTGKLRNSYNTRSESKSSEMANMRTGTDVEYAPDQEFGNSRMPGKSHLRPGFNNHHSEMLSAAESKLKGII